MKEKQFHYDRGRMDGLTYKIRRCRAVHTDALLHTASKLLYMSLRRSANEKTLSDTVKFCKVNLATARDDKRTNSKTT